MESKNRELLQDIGQKLREVDEDVWVKYLIKRVEGNLDTLYVLSDVRQGNEYDSFVAIGFTPIKVECELEERIKRIEERDGIVIDDEYINRLEKNNAETGADAKTYEFIIDNNGSKPDLYCQVDNLVRELKGDSI